MCNSTMTKAAARPNNTRPAQLNGREPKPKNASTRQSAPMTAGATNPG